MRTLRFVFLAASSFGKRSLASGQISMPYIRPKKPSTYVQMQSLISFEGHLYYWRKVKGSHHIHQQTECSWGGFLIVVKTNIISGLFVGCCACLCPVGFCLWDFVRGILSCGILDCGILSVGFCPVGFCPVGLCPGFITVHVS